MSPLARCAFLVLILASASLAFATPIATAADRGSSSPSAPAVACATGFTSISPCNGSRTLAPSTTSTLSFNVRAVSGSQDLAFSCSVSGQVLSCSTSPEGAFLASGASRSVTVTYTTKSTTGTGSVTFTAEGRSVVSSTYTIAVEPAYRVVTTPDGGTLILDPATSLSSSYTFRSTNTGANSDTYTFTTTCTNGISCSTPSPVTVGPGGFADLVVNVSVPGGGPDGTTTLTARSSGNTSVTDAGSVNVNVYTRQPTIWPDGDPITTTAGRTYKQTFTVRNDGEVSANYTLTTPCSGTAVTSCSARSSLSLFAASQDTVTVTYTTGGGGTSGQVRLRAQATNQSDDGYVSVANHTYDPQVIPQVATMTVAPSSSYSAPFVVKNNGTARARYDLAPLCSGNLTCASPSSGFVELDPSQTTNVSLSFTTFASNPAGLVRLRATYSSDGSIASEGSITVGDSWEVAPVATVASANPEEVVERDLCLLIEAGSSAGNECGDLRIAHALPTITTRNKARTPTLLYNSQHARPYPLVSADVLMPADAIIPVSVEAVLTVNGGAQTTQLWSGSEWLRGATRRITLGFDGSALATGIYDYSVQVTNVYPSSRKTLPAVPGRLVVVNRSASPYGAGWWVAGLEQLNPSTMMWVGGDGSVRRYTLASGYTDRWVAPSVDRPDTIKRVGASYERYLSQGIRVRFDAGGRHTETVNRLGDTTYFLYDGSNRLALIQVPPNGTSLLYTFGYSGSGFLQTVTAPDGRQVTLAPATGTVTQITDADTRWVSFGVTNNRITARTDRRGSVTSYGYDLGWRLNRVTQEMEASTTTDDIVTTFVVQQTRGLPGTASPVSTDPARLYTKIDGPRSDVADTAAFWLDRFGAPTKMANAAGQVTTLIRGDNRWPAVVTEVRASNGFTTRATYDARGNMATTTQVNPFGTGDATTSYEYDGRFDFATKATLPTGEFNRAFFDPVNGNRQWEQAGDNTATRVTYGYTGDQLTSVLPPGNTTPSRFTYDARGNHETTTNPRGSSTRFYRDAAGRAYRQDHTFAANGSHVDTRTEFSRADEDTLQITVAYDGSVWADSLIIRKKYDEEGNLRRVVSRSSPDRARVDTIVHTYEFDRANRKISQVQAGKSESWVLDNAGNVLSGSFVDVTTYDALNRPILRVGTTRDSLVYDTDGFLKVADNADAKVRRTYYPNGALKIDTVSIATDDRQTWYQYVLRYDYDLSGRRKTLHHSPGLLPGARQATDYQYDPLFGSLSQVTDPAGNIFTLQPDNQGRLYRLTSLADGATPILEEFGYDDESNLTKRWLSRGGSYIRQGAIAYDLRGKVTSGSGFANNGGTSYTALGAVRFVQTNTGEEQFVVDALGNRASEVSSVDQSFTTTFAYDSGTGRLKAKLMVAPGDTSKRDSTRVFIGTSSGFLTGQTRRTRLSAMADGQYRLEVRSRNSFYDNKGRMIESSYQFDTVPTPPTNPNYVTYIHREYYRYDALGRRVWRKLVRGSNCSIKDRTSGCRSFVVRTVWDGSDMLYEERGTVTSTEFLESGSYGGMISYVNGQATDRPLALYKTTSPAGSFGDFIVPHLNWQGAIDAGSCATALCPSSQVVFPGLGTVFGRGTPFPNGPPSWYGSIIEETEASGYQYKRNRYYDPETGRFTTVDPIGIAGGLNVYGYVGGDPVNFSDPFGLCPVDKPLCQWIEATSTALGSLGGFIIGGGGPALTGVGVVASPFTAMAGAATGAGIGLAAGKAITGAMFSEDASSAQGGSSSAPEYKVPVSGKSGAEAARDVPSWAKGNRPLVGENGKTFAGRLLDGKYGPGKWKGTGPGSEFNKIKKWGDRGFVDPKR